MTVRRSGGQLWRTNRRARRRSLDELLNGEDPKEAFLNGGLIDDLKQAIADRALNAEMDVHLEQDEEQSSGNHRNGISRKRVLTDSGAMDVSIPRDRQGRFDPQLIEKYRRRLPGFDDKVIALYSRGMTTREIQAHVREFYGVDVSHGVGHVIKCTRLGGFQSRIPRTIDWMPFEHSEVALASRVVTAMHDRTHGSDLRDMHHIASI